tara:strand:- start:129 stop:407 length:279 start_codon:yes stop_codon:yes gene_type:complete
MKKKTQSIRIIDYRYIKEVLEIVTKNKINPSSRRIRRLVFLDLYLPNYTNNMLYQKYRKLVSKDASNFQRLVLFIAISILTVIVAILFKISL